MGTDGPSIDSESPWSMFFFRDYQRVSGIDQVLICIESVIRSGINHRPYCPWRSIKNTISASPNINPVNPPIQGPRNLCQQNDTPDTTQAGPIVETTEPIVTCGVLGTSRCVRMEPHSGRLKPSKTPDLDMVDGDHIAFCQFAGTHFRSVSITCKYERNVYLPRGLEARPFEASKRPFGRTWVNTPRFQTATPSWGELFGVVQPLDPSSLVPSCCGLRLKITSIHIYPQP